MPNLPKVIPFTKKGLHKDLNEDHIAFDQQQGVYVIADGIGGLAYGHIASEIVATATLDYLTNYKRVDLKILAQVIQQNLEIASNVKSGSTLAAIQISDKQLHSYHVGDSKVMIWFKDGSHWASKDHSLVQELVDSGELTPKQASVDRRRNIITRSFSNGGLPRPVIESKSFPISEIRAILLITDGILGQFHLDYLIRQIEKEGVGFLEGSKGLDYRDDCSWVYLEM